MSFGKRSYSAHRLAWLWMTGAWPKSDIDHINRDKSDNRFSNLREATKSENKANVGRYANNTSGHKGVHWNAKNQKWMAQIMVRRKRIYLGLHLDLADAASSYASAASKYFGEYARAE